MSDVNNLAVLTFEGAETASAVYAQIEQMEHDKLLEIKDAVIIERSDAQVGESATAIPSGSGQLNTAIQRKGLDGEYRVIQTHGKKGNYAAKGGGIGLLAGFLLGGPIGGLVVGAGIGAITAAMKDLGIDNDNIELIKARLQPNSSALLVLGHVDDRDAFVARLRTYDPKVVSTTLTPEVEQELRTRLSE